MANRPSITFFEKLSKASYSELWSLWLVVNILCTVVYFWLATMHPSQAPSHLSGMDSATRLFNSFYFSIITAVSVGYGDIIPLGLSKLIAMGQSIISLLVFAVLVAKLVSHRQDVTLEEVHRMTSEGIFYNLRQGLFLVRKDFDTLIHQIDEHKTLTEQDWEMLGTSYLQAQNLIEEIPNLYNGQGHDLYTIDVKREKLLIEAIHRTLRRTEKLLANMDKYSIQWKQHAESTEEFAAMLDIIDSTMPMWREKSKTPPNGTFDETMEIAKNLRKRIS